MKRMITLLLGAATVAVVALSVAPIGATPTAAPSMDVAPPPVVLPAPEPVPSIDAQALWKKTCAKCHGLDGKAETKFAKKLLEQGHKIPNLTTSDDSVEEFIKAIADGVPDTKMKPYGKRLKGPQIKALAEFARAFRD